MTTKELLLEQFDATYGKQGGWFVTIYEAIDGLTEEQADWKDEKGNHSIKGILLHMAYWNERVLMRFNGVTPPKMIEDNNKTFNLSLSWAELLGKIKNTGEGFNKAISEMNEENAAKIEEIFKAPWESIAANFNLHNAYHIGQIVNIRKLQGSWDSDKGIK